MTINEHRSLVYECVVGVRKAGLTVVFCVASRVVSIEVAQGLGLIDSKGRRVLDVHPPEQGEPRDRVGGAERQSLSDAGRVA